MRSLRALLLMVALVGCWGDDTRRVALVPIGPLPADLLLHLRRELPSLVNGEVIIAAQIPHPQDALDPVRQQYLGNALLDQLKRHDVADADRVVGVIDADMYAPGLNFILGQSMKPGRFAVVALPRLRHVDEPRFRERVLKVTTHELGHSFGYAHCPEAKCVMRFANSVAETDSLSVRFCRRH